MRRQDDGDAAFAQAVHQLPHVAAQRDVDAGGGFVEEQDFGFVRQRLGDQHAALHAARQLHDLGVALVPQRQVAKDLFDIGAVARAAEQPPRKGDGGEHGFEHVDRQFLRHEADAAARGLIVGDGVMPATWIVPVDGVTMPQMMLISVVLPAPFGPSSAKISPLLIVRSTLWRAVKPPL